MAYCCSISTASIPEEILGSVRKPPEDSHRCGQSTSCTGKIDLRTRPWSTAPAVERDRSEVAAGKLLYTQYTMADTADIHPTDGRRRREKGPPSRLALPRLERVSDTECGHSEDSAGEKEAKRQRSNPGTPVSTPHRMPYDYDAVMGITRVGTREAEGFDEDLDSTEYHDANDTTEETTRKEEGTEADTLVQRSMDFQGGFGSSSLKECIELLNTTTKIAPAPLDSGVGNSADPHAHTRLWRFFGGALKERRNGRAGKRSSKHLEMDNNKLSTKNPQLDSPGKIHTFWIKATCDSRFCVLDASEQKTNSLELTDGLPRRGPSDWDKVAKDERSVFRLSHNYLETEHTHSHEDKSGLLETQRSDLRQRCREEPAIFLDNLSGQEMYSPKPANGLSKTP